MIEDDDTPPSNDLEENTSPGSTESENEQKTSSEVFDTSTEDNLSEEEKMAKEWEAMNSSDSNVNDDDLWNQSVINAQKALDQSEIDNLLGDDQPEPETHKKRRGSEILLSNKTVYYERLPMLEVVFDRLVRMLSTTFRNFTSTNVDITLSKTSTMKFGDYLSKIPLPAMLGVFKSVEWENQGLIFVDSNLIYSTVDVLLGNRRGQLLKIEGRPYTTIERHLIERLMRLVMIDMKSAFQPICEANFEFERLEINPDFAAIARESNAVLVAKMRLVMESRQGDIEILLPYATIEPVRELLLQNFMGEKFGRDAIWENHLADRLWGTDIEVQAIFQPQTHSLYDVLNWEVGSKFYLNSTLSDPVQLRCGEHLIGLGKAGQKSGKVSVRLETLSQGEKQ
jgi:flagellar motor switch protein FliM